MLLAQAQSRSGIWEGGKKHTVAHWCRRGQLEIWSNWKIGRTSIRRVAWCQKMIKYMSEHRKWPDDPIRANDDRWRVNPNVWSNHPLLTLYYGSTMIITLGMMTSEPKCCKSDPYWFNQVILTKTLSSIEYSSLPGVQHTDFLHLLTQGTPPAVEQACVKAVVKFNQKYCWSGWQQQSRSPWSRPTRAH